MPSRRSEMTREDLSVTREDIQNYLDSGRAKKSGQPDRSKPHGKSKQEIATFLSGKGIKDEALLDKMLGDLDSYL